MTAKEIAGSFKVENKHCRVYIFSPEELQAYTDALCKEQRELCAKHYAFWYKSSEAELELIKGLPQPEAL